MRTFFKWVGYTFFGLIALAAISNLDRTGQVLVVFGLYFAWALHDLEKRLERRHDLYMRAFERLEQSLAGVHATLPSPSQLEDIASFASDRRRPLHDDA